MTLWILLAVGLALALLLVFYIWYQNRRARASFKNIDHSKLNDLSKDAWEDDKW